ncbi:MAG TPA: DNA gyrase subunit A [Clostridia bacterium]|nr:DNA gyrase subunit A [Clostridia bacterium]
MSEAREKIIPINITKEMKQSYLDYAMSVIVGRALPDVRDGLKPVHRRILYAMHELGMTADKPHRKSAHIVGNVLAKYHPHGDTAVYDTIVRMAQDFSLRYPLIDGHGNFGSVDGDAPAAMRYTEARMSRIAAEMLEDIAKDTVDFIPNYDNSTEEPTVLPAKIPSLLINGSDGIAVGMATKIPPHNLNEVIDGLIMLIDNPEISVEDLFSIIRGPDFPTGAKILGKMNILKAYRTGRGAIRVRACTDIVTKSNGRSSIIVTEIPYQVNKARLIEKIASLVKEKRVEGISALRDESDREGMRIIIELKRDVNPQVLLNQLYKHTQLQDSYGIIMLALVDGQPRVLKLKEVLHYYLEHRKDVVTRRTRFDLKKAEDRAHIVEGLRIALENLDEVIRIIRASRTTEIAKKGLIDAFDLTPVQAQAILDMRLQRLTGLEIEKLESEYRELVEKINYFRSVLADINKVMGIIKEELLYIKQKYGDKRRTQIVDEYSDLEDEDLIPVDDVVITLTSKGYIKRTQQDLYRSQRRGGRGITATTTKDGDFVRHLFVTTTHHYLLIFTNKGKVYRVKAYEIPEASRQARGMAIVNLLPITLDEKITTIIPVQDFNRDELLFMSTQRGIVKKTYISDYNTSRKDGIIALTLDEGDSLIDVSITEGDDEIFLGTKKGYAIRFLEKDARPIGRTARGVIGIDLSSDDEVIGMGVVKPGHDVLVVTANGYGKRTSLEAYRPQRRGGKGLLNYRKTDVNGDAVAIQIVGPNEEVMLINNEGIIIRLKTNEISKMGRATQGVKLMRVTKGDRVVAMAKLNEAD